MTPDEYLEQVLENQRLTEVELDELRQYRADVQAVLEEHFSESTLSIHYAGSYKKKTMIRDSYDLDIACYFDHGDTSAGANLQEIYNAVYDALTEDYHVERKRSVLRMMEKGVVAARKDLRIDVVPGRYTDDGHTDVFLHQETGEKARLKTNLQVHVARIRDSGVRDAIKLVKLWKCQRNIPIKTFVLELLVVDLLRGRKSTKLRAQFTHVLTEFRDHAEDLSVEDPANGNNDLAPLLDQARASLASWASHTLGYIEEGDWESVFGKLPGKTQSSSALAAALGTAAASAPPSRPWLPRP